jgi:Carboxypeptidase regulatory-like domain
MLREVLTGASRLASGLCLALVVMTRLASAQGVTSTVSGTVKDAQGGVIPGATVMLVSESKGTLSTPVVTNSNGDFVFPNIIADTYTVRVAMPSFKVLNRTGIKVSPGSNIALGTVTIDIGGQSEVVNVVGESPVIQTATGEKSFSIDPQQAEALPLGNRSYVALLLLAPGVNVDPNALASQLTTGSSQATAPTSRIGGGGGDNYMTDGVTTMDPGVNRPASRVSSEAISEVKVDTFGYQAEYGRSSGLQINAVTKSGSNQYRGSLYDVERHSNFGYANSKTNILNGDPKPTGDQRDWGWSIGGPIGKAGGSNKLFFFYNQEFNPRITGNTVSRFRMPTALERQGDFSKSTDQQGQPYPFIKDPAKSGACNATSQVACFADGGVLGKIPASSLYSTGLAILNWWPLPNLENVPAGQAYNWESTYPSVSLLGYQPVIRLDYAPTQKLRANFKYQEYQQPIKTIPGTIPGWNDSTQDDFGIYTWSSVINYTLNNSMFLEGSFGRNTHHQEGCSIVGGDPNWCITGDPVNAISNRNTAGFGAIPYLFPDATIIDPSTRSYQILQNLGSKTTIWDGTRIQAAPTFAWGSRILAANAPPNNSSPFNNFILDTVSGNANFSLTKVTGPHTLKIGYYYFKSVQKRGTGAIYGSISFANDTNNPLDSSFGFANAALGVFSSYSQLSRWGEGAFTGINHEAYVQDNWKVTSRLTLDYGIRFVHQVPNYDGYETFSNFFPDQWTTNSAPRLYVFGCDTGVYPCATANRRAMDPLTKQFIGTAAQSGVIVGTLVPGTGSSTNGLQSAGKGIADTGFTYPAVGYAPRFGAAWDLHGNQQFVVRGGGGLFFDRPPANSIYGTVNNPPFAQNVTVRYGLLQNIGAAGLTTVAPPALTVFEYDNKLPASFQWNIGIQMALPFTSAIDVSYTGQHSYNAQLTSNLNSIDLGLAYLPQYQDPTQTPNGVATSLVNTNVNQVRFYPGYGNVTQNQPTGVRTYHSIQVSWARRLKNGLSLGFNDTISLYDKQSTTLRLQHNADGTISVRSDQALADEMLGDNHPQTHIMRANFIVALPSLHSDQSALKTIGYIVNDWSVAGIWVGSTGAPYSATFSYTSNGANLNLTGSPDYGARIVIAGDQGAGCSSDPYKQFNTAAFQGPQANSVGLESGAGYLKGCFVSSLDVSLSRIIRLGKGRSITVRFDTFNLFNQAAIIGRNAQAVFASPATNTVITNLPYDANGNLIPTLSQPKNAGFGVANAYQSPRTMQFQVRFSF